MTSIIDELEATLASGSGVKRTQLLTRVTDLFVDGSVDYSDEQIALFDEVFQQLIKDIEGSAKQELARRLSTMSAPPVNVTRVLALDEAAAVAAPLLAAVDSLEDTVLIECAQRRGQRHLLAISERSVITERVTDILVVRGDDLVIHSVAANSGARFSNQGYGTLIHRADGDDELASLIGTRPDLPRHHFLRLLAGASDLVRARLQATREEPADEIQAVVARVTNSIAARTAAESRNYSGALDLADKLHRAGRLGDAEVRAAAAAGRFEHTVAALSLLCDLPIVVVERAMLQSRPESLLLMAKSIGLSWPTTRAVLQVRFGAIPTPAHVIEQALASFERMKRSTAEQVVAFQRARKEE